MALSVVLVVLVAVLFAEPAGLDVVVVHVVAAGWSFVDPRIAHSAGKRPQLLEAVRAQWTKNGLAPCLKIMMVWMWV